MGGSAQSAPIAIQPTSSGSTGLNLSAIAAQDPVVGQALADYGAGKISLEEALQAGGSAASQASSAANEARLQAIRDKYDSQIQQASQGDPLGDLLNPGARQARELALAGLREQRDAELAAAQQASQIGGSKLMQELITTSPIAAQRYLQDELRTGATTRGLFGEGGALENVLGQQKQLSAEEEALRQRGYSLTPEDYEAYGQMSDQLARAFGQQEKALGSSLARQGLAAAPSGQAATLFSGLAGNKAEQLANAQRQVAQARMQSTEQRLSGLRHFLGQQQQYGLGLGGLQETAKGNLYNRNLAGRGQTQSELAAAAGQSLAQQQALQDQYNTQFGQLQATAPATLTGAIQGLAGTAAGALGGGVGTRLGSAVGSGLFGGRGSSDPLYGTGGAANWDDVF